MQATTQEAGPDYRRPRTKFLTVVWGKAYIRRFAELALPSFLAPGNLPALAAVTELEVVIMTQSQDVGHFEDHVCFRELRAICPVRFVAIDDLISTRVYGVTLTLAYARPIIACGAEMLNTHFVFMNADFVLADGSLRALSKHILGGRSIVLGPSFRAIAEELEPQLERSVDTVGNVLCIPPRQLAALSMPYPHATTVAKVLNQGFLHSSHPNQFFWKVDENTLLGRYYLIFMLCLKPERIIRTINSFCDYALIPELCPSGDEVVMGDSDEFFMLELQSRDQELGMLEIGRLTDRQIARSLQEWTTAEHRRAATHDVVFHTGHIPPQIETARAEATAFVERIGRKLGPPVPHPSHNYWVRGVEAWRHYRKLQGLPTSPPELAPTTGIVRLRSLFWSFVYWCFRVSFGLGQRATVLSPGYLDYRMLIDAVDTALAGNAARVLVVRNSPQLIDGVVSARLMHKADGGTLLDFEDTEAILDGNVRSTAMYSQVFVYLLRKDCRQARRIVEQCRQFMSSGAVCQVFIHHLHGEQEAQDFSRELLSYVNDIVGSPPIENDCLFVGGKLKRFTTRSYRRIRRIYGRFGTLALPVLVPLVLAWIPLVVASNMVLRLTAPGTRFVSYCSSLLLRFSPVRESPPVAVKQRSPALEHV